MGKWLRRLARVGICSLLLAGVPAQEAGDDLDRLKAENAALREELGRLKADMVETRNALIRLKADRSEDKPAVAVEGAGGAVGTGPSRTSATPEPAPGPPATGLKGLLASKFKVNFYGYIKLDASWDTHRTSTGDFTRWVESEAANRDDGECNVTANDTRLGLDFSGPNLGRAKTTAKFEMDFYGGGTENKPVPMLRHAYLQIEWPQYNFSVLAGQSWDLISPLFPYMINYSTIWWAGNISYRHPQIRLTKGFKLGKQVVLTLQGAMTRTIGDAFSTSPGDTGEDSVIPTFQGRLALQFPGWGGQNVVIGVSGHRGRDEVDRDAQGNRTLVGTWSGNVDLTLPLTRTILFKGELFRGANLDEYFGGVGQGVNPVTLRPVASTGGWVSLALGPWRKWRFNLGAACEDPNDDDLNPGDRNHNAAIFGNALFDFNEALTAGFEVSHWRTEYKQKAPGDAFRFQTSLIYRF